MNDVLLLQSGDKLLTQRDNAICLRFSETDFFIPGAFDDPGEDDEKLILAIVKAFVDLAL